MIYVFVFMLGLIAGIICTALCQAAANGDRECIK